MIVGPTKLIASKVGPNQCLRMRWGGGGGGGSFSVYSTNYSVLC